MLSSNNCWNVLELHIQSNNQTHTTLTEYKNILFDKVYVTSAERGSVDGGNKQSTEKEKIERNDMLLDVMVFSMSLQ